MLRQSGPVLGQQAPQAKLVTAPPMAGNNNPNNFKPLISSLLLFVTLSVYSCIFIYLFVYFWQQFGAPPPQQMATQAAAWVACA